MTEQEKTILALLFAAGDPLPAGRLAALLEVDEHTCRKMLRRVADFLDEADGPLEVIRMEDDYQLTTRPRFEEVIRKALEIRRSQPLSQAALEVLAVIAYNQPVTRAFVEQVRGVDCSGVISTLTERDLIEEKGRLELPGRPISYGTTAHFLRSFSLSALEELPPIPTTAGEAEVAGQLQLEQQAR